MKLFKFALVGISGVLLAACGTPAETPTLVETEFNPAEAKLTVDAQVLDANRVQFIIETNIPTPVEVTVGVSLAGQASKDVSISHYDRLRLEGPKTTYILDTSASTKPLPTGEYEAKVTFYPRWGADNGNPAAKAAPELEAIDNITLEGSGEERATAERRNELQLWVMLNLSMNEPWNQSNFEAKLGPSEKGPSTLSHLHDAYYFPEADITLIVNRLKGEATVWRLGHETK